MAAVIGKLFEPEARVPIVHPPLWARELTTGPERLRIGGGERSTETMLVLAANLTEPLFVVVDLRASRTGENGRWESLAFPRSDVEYLVREFSALFERDARAGLWIGETAGAGLLVLDEHDLVYAYGPLDAFEATLASLGYADGVIELPDPHEHHYNAELDHLEARIRTADCWNRVLPPSDDESQ